MLLNPFLCSAVSEGPGAAFPAATAAESVKVLTISPFEEDHRKLTHIFEHSRWILSHAEACEEAETIVRQDRTPVVICEKKLAGRCWQHVLRRLNALDHRPAPRLIVTAWLADDELWSEVLNFGAYNVLEKPFDPREVFWVVSHAWLDWKSERDRDQRGAGKLELTAGV